MTTVAMALDVQADGISASARVYPDALEERNKSAGLMDVTWRSTARSTPGHIQYSVLTLCGAALHFRLPARDAQHLAGSIVEALQLTSQFDTSLGMPSVDGSPNEGQSSSPSDAMRAASDGVGA